jgi:hypothetical protein
VQKRYLLALAEHDLAGAITKLRRFHEEQPFRADSWKTLGELLSRARQPELAARAFQEALLRDVHDTESRARLGISIVPLRCRLRVEDLEGVVHLRDRGEDESVDGAILAR